MPNTDPRENIKEALGAFVASGALNEAAVKLFAEIGYQSERMLPDLTGDVGEFLDAFKGERLNEEERALIGDYWQSVYLLFQFSENEIPTESLQRNLNLADESAGFNSDEYESFVFIAVELEKERELPRGELARMTRAINRLFAMPAIVLFYHCGRITLAVIHRRAHKRRQGANVMEKVTLIKDINVLTPHRAHLDILASLSLDERLRWIALNGEKRSFEGLHAAWMSALDVSELSDRFYKEIVNWFYWAIDRIEYPANVGDEEGSRENWLIRLITRLLFCWFVKEKGLIPPVLFNREEIKGLLSDDLPDSGDSYYKAILQNLFFATLNSEMNTPENRKNRRFRTRTNKPGRQDQHFMAHSLYRYERFFRDSTAALQLFANVPFLNGGIFECLDYSDKQENGERKDIRIDGFSDAAPPYRKNPLHVPNDLFFSDRIRVDLSHYFGENAREREVRGILSILNAYKFTIEESTPIEEEIALDPELLGHIFENLLAAVHPKTGQSIRKMTGSFYTPRQVVDFMVDETLTAYFVEQVRADGDNMAELEGKIRELLRYGSEQLDFSETQIESLVLAIDGIKILDPAVGSGAFPMGVLNKLVSVLAKLDPDNERWMERQINRAEAIEDPEAREQTIEEIEKRFANNQLGYGRKLFLIENCIYGIDLQPIAIQIARLRFFISLLVDQKHDGEKPNFGVTPLPNLECNFITANSLIALKFDNDMWTGEINDKKDKLRECRRRYFAALTFKTKMNTRNKYYKLRNELADLLKEESWPLDTVEKIRYWDPYDPNAVTDWFNPDVMFGETNGFNIIIGNPPYARSENLEKDVVDKLKKEFGWSDDLYLHFIIRCLDFISDGGIYSYIANDSFVGLKTKLPARDKFLENNLIKLVRCPKETFTADIYAAIFVLAKGESPSNEYETGRLTYPDYDYDCWGNVAYETANKLPHKRLSYYSPVLALFERISESRESGRFENSFDFLDAGIHSGNVRHKIFHVTKAKGLSRLIQGKQMGRWYINWDLPGADYKWCNPDYVPQKEYGIGRGGEKSSRLEVYKLGNKRQYHHLPERLLMRQTADNLVVTYHNEEEHGQFYTDNTLFTIAPKPFSKRGLKYALALFNSKLLNALYQFLSQEEGKALAQVKVGVVKSLPFVAGKDKEESKINALVDRILAAKREDITADVTELESQIDKHVYAIYGLSEDEIKLVE